MAKTENRTGGELLQGTLDLLILRTLLGGPMNGHAISKRIHLISEEVLRVEEGSLYPALHRLELDGAVEGNWSVSENHRRAKYYQITAYGRKQLEHETARWARISTAVVRVLEMA